MKVVEKKLTPKIKTELDRYKAIDVKGDFKYIPDVFKRNLPIDKCPVFTISYLTSVIELDGSTEYSPNGLFSMGRYRLYILRNCVKSWTNPDNVFGVDFKPEFIIDGVLSNDAIKRMSVELITELSNAASNGSNLNDDEIASL